MYLRCVLLCNYCASQSNAWRLAIIRLRYDSSAHAHAIAASHRSCAHVKSKMMVLLGRKFCKAKAKKRGARDLSSPYKDTKEQDMAYLILVAVVAMMALYALIIVGCLKQPEW